MLMICNQKKDFDLMPCVSAHYAIVQYRHYLQSFLLGFAGAAGLGD
jgi:hypothetical protein